MEFSSVGHSHQKRLLESLAAKLPHALLLTGPGGVGKRTIALEFIQHLFCEKGAACGVCRGCRMLKAGLHPDFRLVAGEGSIKIDELRALAKEVYEPPYEAKVRAVLIDNAELMTREAANALLKTLEEPPPSNFFVLVSSREREIPLTVRSRCMRIGFGPLSAETVAAYLEKELKITGQKAAGLAAISDGSISAGLFWMEEENYRTRQGIAELLSGRGRTCAKASVLAERMAAKGHEMEYLSFLLSFFRDVWWLCKTGEASNLVNGDLAGLMDEAAAGGPAWAESSIARVLEMMRTLRYNVNKWLAWENLMLHIMRQI